MNIASGVKNLIKPPKGNSIVDQAKELKVSQKMEKIKKVVIEIVDIAKKKIYDANLEVADYNVVTGGVEKAMSHWFNTQINERPIQDVVDDPDPQDEPTQEDQLPLNEDGTKKE